MQQGFCLKREHALVEEGSELTAEDLKSKENRRAGDPCVHRANTGSSSIALQQPKAATQAAANQRKRPW